MSGLSGLAAMDRGEADLAVRLARPEDPDLVTRRIGLIRFALYVTPEWAALPPAEWQFIAYDPTLHHLSQEAWLRAFVAARPVVFEASDLFAQHAAARAGLGAALLPRFMGDADAGLIRTGPAPPTRDIWLLTYPDLRRAPAIRRAMDFLVEAVGRICPLLP